MNEEKKLQQENDNGKDTDACVKEMNTLIKSCKPTGYIVAGVVLILAGTAAAVYCFCVYFHSNISNCFWDNPMCAFIFVSFFVLLAQAGGILCLSLAKKCIANASVYKCEVMAFNNLQLAIKLSDRLSDTVTEMIPQSSSKSTGVTATGAIQVTRALQSNSRMQIIQALIDKFST